MNQDQKYKIAIEALEEISDYYGSVMKNLKPDERLNGALFMQIADNPNTYIEIAKTALSKLK